MIIEDIEKELSYLGESHLLRRLTRIDSSQASRITIMGNEYINLSSNNYLGLCDAHALKRATIEAVERYGGGAGASRLVCGNMDIHEKLERVTAEFKGSEEALVFNTGYMANIGILQAIAGDGDVIFSDELNHASIIDGCRLSRADVFIYRHRDVKGLETLLSSHKHYRRKIVVTESVFSMDGDIAPLAEIYDLTETYDAILVVDDAHATGVLGKEGRGSIEYFGLAEKVKKARGRIIQMGTYGKALGSFGAYVACNREIKDYLINRARSFIYTTALPPPVIASAIAGIREILENRSLVKKLRENISIFRKGLRKLGYDVSEDPTPIVPIIPGDVEKVMRFAEGLMGEGIYAVAIRPPTVPEGTGRIRISITAGHSKADIEVVTGAMERVGKKLGIL